VSASPTTAAARDVTAWRAFSGSFELGQLLLPRPRRRGVDVGDQPLQAVGGALVQPRHGGSTEPVGRGGAGAGYQPVERAEQTVGGARGVW
jgi:hypothetical protein